MGCTSEKSIPELNRNKKALITDSNIELDLNDIEKQGESKHPQRVIINDNKIEEEKNYYNYNLNDLILVNKTKMTVKRIENFVDDDDDSESEEDNKNLENKEEENNEDDDNENKEVHNFEQNEDLKENKNNNIDEIGEDDDKKPEDKKPPNIEKLKKKGKEKKEISIF